jgi:hypothetical protein
MEKKVHHFRAVLDEFLLLEGSRQLAGTLSWNEERDVVIFDAADLLPGEKKLQARAKISFEEKLNNQWTKVKFNGKVVTESAESNFETGKAPDFIPDQNIAVSYPLLNQLNFHPKEYPTGFVQLKDGQPYLFTPRSDWIQKIRMTESLTGRFIETAFTYDPTKRQVTFGIPEGLQNSKIYRLEIINIPKQNTVIDQNIQRVGRELSIDQSAGTATLTTQSFNGELNMLETKSILQTYFKTSQYNTFVEKMQHISLAPVIRLSPGINIFQLISYLKGDESFEEVEVSEKSGMHKLLHPEAVTEGNQWYEQYAFPLIYEGYPLLGWMKVNRPNPEQLGIPPVRDVYFDNIRSGLPLLNNVDSPSLLPFTDEYLVYNLGQSVASDFRDMQRHAVNYAADHPSEISSRLTALVIQPLPHIRTLPNKTSLCYSRDQYNFVQP